MRIPLLLTLLVLFFVTHAWGADRQPRIAVGGLRAESNSFYPALAQMRPRELPLREEWLREGARGRSVRAGLIEGAADLGLDLYPITTAAASFLGKVSDESFSSSLDALVDDLRNADPPYDGVFLDLHGAMVVESHPHGDAEVARRVREAMGPDFPIVVTNDFHGNVAPELVESCNVLITYKEHPHLDTKERGLQAARIMASMLEGEVRPVQAIEKPAVLINLIHQDTFTGVLKPIVAESRRLEAESEKILAVSVPGGYQWADVPQMGPSVIVVTDGDPELARREAKRLSEMVFDAAQRLTFEPPETAAAVRKAMESEARPVVLMDTGDNIGGGSAGDSTFLLEEFLRQKTEGWVMSIMDRKAVEEAAKVGVGSRFSSLVGARTDDLHGSPVRVTGYVRSLRNSQYDNADMTAVIEVDGSTRDLQNLLILTSRATGARSVQELIANGIDPARQTVIVSKGVVAPFATFRDVAGEIIMANTPGPTDVNPRHFKFQHLRRPFRGVD